MSRLTYDLNVVAEALNFRANDRSLAELSDADLDLLLVSLAQGLMSERGLTAIAMCGLHVNVNGVPAQDIAAEVKRRQRTFTQRAFSIS